MGFCKSWEKSKGPKVPSIWLGAAWYYPFSQTRARHVNHWVEREASREQREKPEALLRFSRPRPKLEHRLPLILKVPEGPGCSSRGHGEELLPTSFPFFKEPDEYTTQLKWQRRLRHGAPRSNGPGVRRRRWASATTRHSGHFERTRQPRLCCLPLSLSTSISHRIPMSSLTQF